MRLFRFQVAPKVSQQTNRKKKDEHIYPNRGWTGNGDFNGRARILHSIFRAISKSIPQMGQNALPTGLDVFFCFLKWALTEIDDNGRMVCRGALVVNVQAIYVAVHR